MYERAFGEYRSEEGRIGMTRIGKLFLVASLLLLPLAMAGCPAEEETTGAPAPKKSATPSPGLGGQIGSHAVFLNA